MIGRLFGKTKVTTERAEDEGATPEGRQIRSLSEVEIEALEQISNRPTASILAQNALALNGLAQNVLTQNGLASSQQIYSYGPATYKPSGYNHKLYLGEQSLSEHMLSAMKLSACAHPALRESLVETLLALADSDSAEERSFAAMHKDLPEAKRIMMLADDDPNVAELAKTILEWSE